MKTKCDADPGRWMLVDDDELSLAMMREFMIGIGGREPECFGSPIAALAAFEKDRKSFELVITDFQMPRMDGMELSQRMMMLSPGIKILLMTGSNLIGAGAVMRNGLCGLLRKPCSLTAVQRVLEMISLRPGEAKKPVLAREL